MCNKAVDSYLFYDWFVTNKIIEKLDSAVFSNDYMVFGNKNFDTVTFFSYGIDLNSINHDNVN